MTRPGFNAGICQSYIESLTRALQARALDIVQAVQHIGVLKQVLTDA